MEDIFVSARRSEARELRLKIAAQILCVRIKECGHHASIPSGISDGISAECIKWADSLIDMHDSMYPNSMFPPNK